MHMQRMKVAQGGYHGLGNARFKTSTNRAPRQKSDGTPGEVRNLKLELLLLADVGLLGMPNAGKSTFIRSVSAAKPKVADYPFTTLVPNLGVVRLDSMRSFVIADIPGLIEGAAEGAGLGIQFLKHLERCRVLLHLVDLMPADGSDPVENAKAIVAELEKYSPKLAAKPRWLVFNKVDLMLEEEVNELCKQIADALEWKDEYFQISAFQKVGTLALCMKSMDFIEAMPEDVVPEIKDDETGFKWDTYHKNTIENASDYTDEDDDDDTFGGDDNFEVVYPNK